MFVFFQSPAEYSVRFYSISGYIQCRDLFNLRLCVMSGFFNLRLYITNHRCPPGLACRVRDRTGRICSGNDLYIVA